MPVKLFNYINKVRIPKSWILLVIFVVSVISAGAWIYTDPPFHITNSTGDYFGNTKINETGIITGNATVSTLTVSGVNVTEAPCAYGFGGVNTYLICMDGTTTYAKNGTTGKIEYSGTDAGATINYARTQLGLSGHIVLSKGDFISNSEILFDKYYEDFRFGIEISGQSGGTTITYTPNSGYAFKLSSEGAIDSKTVAHNIIKDLTISAPNTVDGAILFQGSAGNLIQNVMIESKENAFVMKKNSYGSINLLNRLDNVQVRRNTNRSIYAINDSQIIITNSNLYQGNPDTIYMEGGFVWLYATQIAATPSTGKSAMTTNNTVVEMYGVYNDNGYINITNGIFRAYASSIPRFNPIGNVDYDVSTSWNIGNLFINTTRIQPEINFINYGKFATDNIEGIGVGESSIDKNASSGYAMRNPTNNIVNYVFMHRYYNNYHIPKGRYMLLIRLRDENQTASGARVSVLNWGKGTYNLNKDLTLTNQYKTYAYTFNISEADAQADMRIFVTKLTTTPDYVYADFYRLVYLGTNFDEFSIGGGAQLQLVDDIGTLPSAGSWCKGMIARANTSAGDKLYLCGQNSTAAYDWMTLISSSNGSSPYDFGNRAIAPAAFGFGDTYHNSTSKEVFCGYNGTDWVNATGNTIVC